MDWLKIKKDQTSLGFTETESKSEGSGDFINYSDEPSGIAEDESVAEKKEAIKLEMKEVREDREVKDKEVADQLIVIHGAKIKFNSHVGEFKVLSDVPTTQDKLTGTVVEKNIPNFTFYDGFTLNTLTMWQSYGTMKVQENEVLIKKSFNPGIGTMPGSSVPEPGKVEFIDSGQIHVPESLDTEGAPLSEKEDKDEDYNDYQLLRDGKVKFLKNRKKDKDRLFASDEKNNLDKSKKVIMLRLNDKSIISELAEGNIPDNTRRYDNANEKAFPLGVNRARSYNASEAGNVYIFAANNSNVEWGLAGYNIESIIVYAIWTGHCEDITPNRILYQGISKLSFEIYSHPGNLTVPSPDNGFTQGDYGSAAWIDSKFAENKNYPRHFLYSKKAKHLWQYTFYDEKSSYFYPGKPNLNKSMLIVDKINLKILEK